MSVKRRDNKNRVLRNGESQRADGRYVYVYVDGNGKQKFLYSWKLENTDKLPYGKRECMSLRDKIKLLNRDLNDGIVSQGGNLTVLELVKKYIGQKTGVRHNTEANYNFVINIIAKDEFGARRIDKVKLSDAKEWLIKLQKVDGRGYKVQLPKITPHVCRHTFCSNMAKGGMNPKTLQYIMGHSDIGVTLNTYTHLGVDDAEEEMKKVCNA